MDGFIYSFTNVVFCLFYIYILSIPKRFTIASLVARRARWSQVLLIGAYPTFGTFKKNYRKLSVTKYFGFGLSSWQFGCLGRLCHADFSPVRISVTLMSPDRLDAPFSSESLSLFHRLCFGFAQNPCFALLPEFFGSIFNLLPLTFHC